MISKEILQDKQITKIGVFRSDTATELLKDYGVRVARMFDLRYMSENAGCKPGSMKKMSEKHLNDGDFSCKRIGLFKVFAEKIRKKEKLDGQTIDDFIIDNYCSKYFDVEYDGMKKKLTIETIDDLEKCQSLTQILKLYVIPYTICIASIADIICNCRHCTEYPVLGFDCKWTPKMGLPVALLQLSSYKGLCLVFRLTNFQKIPEELKVSVTLLKTVNIPEFLATISIYATFL